MEKLKICVYAIAKNEEANVERFVRSAAPADYIAVLDTGSTDKTVELLADMGVIVCQERIEPWRFDVARNRSMRLIPEDTDICVCVDLDEELSPGWREKLEEAWHPAADMARFTCVRGNTTFLQGKAHARRGWHWHYPVHEVLVYERECPCLVEVPAMQTVHHPDNGKSRGQYLPLLKLAAKENQDDPRCAHYLGREYFYYGRWEDAIREFVRHLGTRNAWRAERAATMRYLAECYLGLGDLEKAELWALRGIGTAPDIRESWYEAERVYYFKEAWETCAYYGHKAADIKTKSDEYINDGGAWGGGVEDILSVAMWHIGCPREAEEWAERALRLDPGNERVRDNLALLRRENGKEAAEL